ncbi:DUF6531 domain-containing protein [Butyrivibrio proteoclasticus]|uniref:DUF6531 domain-containing protein n=1 Tax=Butyrivibrio proteoclasticus TaxID=43305 RepID=UPI00047D8DAC|nr:DUF6531 domain-containing protein [Butyrivibrio proteoclasticus]
MSEGNNSFEGGDIIEWNHQKIADYFAECGKVYDTFEESINEVAIALNDFVNDGEHRGPEAESAKSFVNERQIEAVEEAIYSVEHLHGMMEGSRLSDEVSLLDDFNERVDASETAIVKSQHLDKVIKDYTEYNNGFREASDSIKSARDACQEAIAGCSFLTYKKFTEPDPEPTKESMEAFVSVENEDGFVQKFEKTFLEFIEDHSDDFTGSEFMAICPVLLENLKNVNAALGDGSFDLTRYDETFQNVKWTDVKELMSEEMRNKFLKYMKDFSLYLKGLVPKCQVIKYDPVNMNNGNYINDITDLTVPGRFPLEFRRFYNAQSDKSGILGMGWSCAFDVRLKKDMDGDIRLTTFDGRELIFSKANIKKEEVYLEVHGEEGILRETQTGYVITRDDNSYDMYDLDGFLVSKGDNNGEHTKIDYTLVTVSGTDTALPVKVTTKDRTSLSLKYNEDGILTEITDHAGRTCAYEYETTIAADTKRYFLVSVTYPNGAKREYDYDDKGLIISIKSPDGVVSLENKYDEKRRVIHQSFPDGGEMSYEYDDENRITTATEQNGCKVQYLSDEFGRHVGTRYVGIRPGQMTMEGTDSFIGEKENESDKYLIEEKFTYNDKNQKTTVTDRNGFVTRHLYDNRGRLVSTIGPEGLHETITYDAEGHMTSKKDSEGNKYKYRYDLEGNLYSITDPEGNKIKYDYVDGRLVDTRDGFGKKTKYTYDDNGNIASVTEPSGKKTSYEYDSLGRAIKSIDNDGNETSYTYDENGNITSVTDPMGNVTRHAYNKAGLLTETINPDGTKKTWQYNEIGKVAAFTDEDGRTTYMAYNTMWQEERIILPNGGEIRYKYDLLGNRVSVTDPENRVTKYTHDKMGNVLTEGHVVSSAGDKLEVISVNKTYTYDGKNRIKTETDGEGNVTTYKYDKNDNLICKTDALGGQTINEYDGLNRLIKTTDPAGRSISYTFDKNGNLKTTTDASGIITENHYDNNLLIKVTQRAKADEDVEITINEYSYDDLGRMATQVERDGFTLNYEYDKAGRVTKTTSSNGRIIEYSYDSMGRVTTKKDCGAVTKYAYTGTGKLCSIIDALGNETRYTYNELDLLCKAERFDGTKSDADVELQDSHAYPQVDRKGHVTIYTHDLSGKVISVTDALGNKDIYKYDRKGELCAEIDRDGNETIYTRDNNGNIIGIKYSNGEEIKYSYDALYTLKQVQDHLGITKIESDSVGRTIMVTTPDGQSVGYEYGPDDAKTAIIYPDGKRLEYKYDAFRKLVELSDLNAETGSVQYYYDSNARLIKKSFPNGTTTSYDYYQGGLLKTLTNTDKEGVLDRFAYTYNEKGNKTVIEKFRRNLDNVSGIYAYSYDEVGRLEAVTREGEALSSFTYDAFGNRTSKTENDIKTIYSYDAQDRLVSKSDQSVLNPTPVITTYSYDNRGNLVAEYKNDVLDREYTYSARNLLEKAQVKTDPSMDQSTYYDYNYLGQRVSKKSVNSEISYLTDITMDYNNLLAQSVNGKTSMFIYDDKIVSMEKENTNSYYLLDELGSTMYLTDTNGTSSDAYAYDVFGKRVNVATGKTVNASNTASTGDALVDSLIQPFTFTGYREEENGLYFAQARSYDPETGRFTGEDKVRGLLDIPDSINHYIYCFNAPKDYVDRNGLYPTCSNTNNEQADGFSGRSLPHEANGKGTYPTGSSSEGGYYNGVLVGLGLSLMAIIPPTELVILAKLFGISLSDIEQILKGYIPHNVPNEVVALVMAVLSKVSIISDGTTSKNLEINLDEIKNVYDARYFIENQSSWEKVLYGNNNMKNAGCGIIATINALHAMGIYLTDEEVANLISEYEKDGAVLNGVLGTSPLAIINYFAEDPMYDVSYTATNDFDEIGKMAEDSDTLIVMLYNNEDDVTAALHYINIEKKTDADGNTYYVTHNAGNPNEQYDSIEEAIEATGEYDNSKPIVVIGISENDLGDYPEKEEKVC